MKFLKLIIILLLSFPSTKAQEEIIEAFTDQIISDDENNNIESLSELIHELSTAPININTASETELNNCMLFSPFQVFGIIKYREKYGLYLSIYELQSIPGFNTEFLKQISPLITVDKHTMPTEKSRPQSMLLSNFSTKYPESNAYLQNDSVAPLYPGSALKTSQRFRYSNGKNIFLGIAYEKDAGELWQTYAQAEHLCGYIRIIPEKLFSNVIIGNFQIHRGLGLVHGLGFNTSTGISLNGYRRSYAKAFASSMEYNYYRGIYAESNLGKWQIDFFLSSIQEDLSLFNFNESKALHECIRNTGIHRSESEINGKDLALRRTTGLSLNQSGRHLKTGLSLSYEQITLTKDGKDSIPDFSELNSEQANLSTYFITYSKSYEIFGEIAINQHIKMAATIGANWQINPAFYLSSSYHYYQPNYSGQFTNAYQAGDDPANQKGINLQATLVPLNNVNLCLNTDIISPIQSSYLSPEMHEIRNSVLLTYHSRSVLNFQVKYNYHHLPKELPQEKAGAMRKYHSGKEKIRFHYEMKLLNSLALAGRFELSHYTFGEINQRASLMYQQIKYKTEAKLQLTYRFLVFNVPSWENRIYCYEPGVRYSFLFPAFYGTGTQNLLLVNYKIGRSLTIRSKIGYLEYKHKRETGSGNSIRPGNHILNMEVQIELRL